MAIKTYKPTTPSRRFRTGYSFDEITTNKPEKSLLRPMKKTGGRNNTGRITSRRRGGGHKRRYRLIDFKRRDKEGIKAKIASIEYDPNRSANIALLHYIDGEKRYIVAPKGLKVGNFVVSGKDAEMVVGNAKRLGDILLGTIVHNVEFKINGGAKIARSAGTYAIVEAKEGNYVQIKLPSGDKYLLRKECYATIGQVGNEEHGKISIGKAGRNRWLGRRPKVRGTAMNPVDHPMGGGEGKNTGGRHPVSPWGKLAKGKKTRKVRKYSDRFIIKKKKKK